MAGRPRTPSNILELRGAFDKHPERRREDAPGAGPFDPEPPATLTGDEIGAWREIVAELPKVSLTASERKGVTQMARIWAQLQKTSVDSQDFKRLDDSFRQWAVQMGLTLQARTKLGSSGKTDKPNRFAGLKAPKSESASPG